MKELKKKAVIYVRVNSAVEEAEKQLEELWAFAESKDFTVTNAYYEIVSGVAHIHNRTIWHLLEDAKQHELETVIVKNISRISRKATDALFVLNELKKYGVKIVTEQGSNTLPSIEATL